VENDFEAAYNKCLELAKQILPKVISELLVGNNCFKGPLGIRAAKQAVNASIEVDLKTGGYNVFEWEIEKILNRFGY